MVAAGAIPIVLGGDHSIAEPDVTACAVSGGPIGLLHFDTHTDTADELHGQKRSHGTPMRRLVEDGIVDPQRYVQIGLRGWWPEAEDLAWQESLGITTFFMHEVEREGIDAVLESAFRVLVSGPVFLTVDVDVLDPAFAPGTGTPEPGDDLVEEVLADPGPAHFRFDDVEAHEDDLGRAPDGRERSDDPALHLGREEAPGVGRIERIGVGEAGLPSFEVGVAHGLTHLNEVYRSDLGGRGHR